MLSRFYTSRLNKAVALLTSSLFILAMFPGCAESPKVPTKQADSFRHLPTAKHTGTDSAAKEYEAVGVGEKPQSAETSIPRPRMETFALTDDPVDPRRLVLDGTELADLIRSALSDSLVGVEQSRLETIGYQRAFDADFGMIEESGHFTKTILFMGFRGMQEPNTGAYIMHAAQNGISVTTEAAEFRVGDAPQPYGFEQLLDSVWMRVSVNGSNQGAARVSFWKCWGLGSAGSCLVCIRSCIASGVLYLKCASLCCLVSSLVVGFGCAFLD